MGDIKLSALTTTTAITTADLLVAVTSAAGSPTDKLINKKMLLKGNVVNTGRTAFLAVPSTDQLNIDTGSSVVVTLDAEVFDQSSDFAANVFTAPVTGKYLLIGNVRLMNLDTAAAYYNLVVKTSNRNYYDTLVPLFSADPAFQTLKVITLADMDAADTAQMTVVQSAGTTQCDVDGSTTLMITFMAGALIC